MLLTSPLTLMKETTLTMEGPSFPSFPSSAGTESFNSSLLPSFISKIVGSPDSAYANEEVGAIF
ncbi:hypothetical protein A2U01_0052702, partial [Trifolium medium]|nr:hypothetical protein [Trifolium medium]